MKVNKPRRKRKRIMGEIDYGVFYTVLLLVAIGTVMIYSASSYYAMFTSKDSMLFLKKQLLLVPLGLGSMLFMMGFDYHKIKKYSIALLLACIPLLLAVFLFPDVNGAQRWIQL